MDAPLPTTWRRLPRQSSQAATSVGGRDFETAHALALQVQQRLEETYPSSQSPTVEQIQDMVEKVLIDTGHSRTAKEYILYRAQRTPRAGDEHQADEGL